MGERTPATQTVRNETTLDPVTQQWRNALFQQGGNLYNQGPPAYYPGSTVVPYSDQTLGGLDWLQRYASQGATGLPQAYDAIGRAMGGQMPGMDIASLAAGGGMQNPFMDALGQSATAMNPFLQNISQIAGMRNQGTIQAQDTAGQVQQATNPYTGANPYAQQIATQAQQGALQGIQGYVNPTQANDYAQRLMARGAQPTTAGVNELMSFATAENPYLDALYDRGAGKVRDQMDARFAAAGRTGANAAYGASYGGALGDLYNNLYGSAYESAQDRALSAAGQLSGISQNDRAAEMAGIEGAAGMGLNYGQLYADVAGQDLSRTLQGLGMAGDLSEAANNRGLNAAQLYSNALSGDADRGLQASMEMFRSGESRLDRMLSGALEQANLGESALNRAYQGASDLAGLGESGFQRQLTGAGMQNDFFRGANSDALAGAGMLPGMYNYGLMPGETMLRTGSAYENLARQYLDADVDRWNYGQNGGWQNLERYAGLLSGLPRETINTQTTQGQPNNRAMSALGAAAVGGGLGEELGRLFPQLGGWGSLLGAGAGGLASLLG